MFSRGLSLAELLIAIVVTAILILAVTSVDITSRRFFRAASKETQVQDEAKIAMEHIVKNLALGNKVYLNDNDKATIWARIDRDTNGDPNSTPGDFGDDTWIAYKHDATGPEDEIWYYPNSGAPTSLSGSHEVISTGFICKFEVSDVVSTNDGNIVTVIVTDDLVNPQTSLTSGVALRCMSIPAI